MLSIAFDPAAFDPSGGYGAELQRLTDWVCASPPAEPGGAVLLPGEIEARTQAVRALEGITLDTATWDQLAAAGRPLGIVMPQPVEMPR